MTIRKLSYIFYLTTTVLIALLTLFVVLRFFESRKLDDALNVRHASFLAADELRQSSDDLTRMARAYVVTGDPKFEQYYWDILAIRNGERERPYKYERSYWDLVLGDPGFEPTPSAGRSLRLQLEQLGVPAAELAKLDEAETRSNELVERERRGLNAMKGSTQGSTDSHYVKSEPDPEFARRLLHDENYYIAKARHHAVVKRILRSDRPAHIGLGGDCRAALGLLYVVRFCHADLYHCLGCFFLPDRAAKGRESGAA